MTTELNAIKVVDNACQKIINRSSHKEAVPWYKILTGKFQSKFLAIRRLKISYTAQ